MLSKLILCLCAATLSGLVCAQAQPEKTAFSADKDLRICGVPKPVGSLKIVDHFGNYWLEQDARYIFEDAERRAYKTLSNDEERDNFIELFWLRRDPTPDTIENEFKDEHYRRIVYANERFSGRVPGWKTDRGRIYIAYGPPDSIEFTTLGAVKQKEDEDLRKYPGLPGIVKQDEGEDLTKYSMLPVEVWRYRYLEGIGREVTFGFTDECGCDDPHLKTGSSAPLFSPYEPLPDLSPQSLGKESGTTKSQTGSIKTFVGGIKWPQTKFKDLEEAVTSKVRFNLLPFQALMNAVRVTEYTDLVPLTMQFRKRDLGWEGNAGTSSVDLHVFARFLTLTGRVAATLEDEIKNSDDQSETQRGTDEIQFSRFIPLRPGRYRLDIAVEDMNAEKMGTWSGEVIVPEFYADELKTSPLILSDQIDTPVRRTYPVGGELYIGDVRIHPRISASPNLPATFHQGEQLGLFSQAYNLSPKPQSRESEAVIGYKIVNIPTGKIALEAQDTERGGEQLTVRRMFSTADIPKGEYAVCVTVNDRIAHKSSTSSAFVRID
jgi:GWxTD domain-containing protein